MIPPYVAFIRVLPYIFCCPLGCSHIDSVAFTQDIRVLLYIYIYIYSVAFTQDIRVLLMVSRNQKARFNKTSSPACSVLRTGIAGADELKGQLAHNSS